jgi:hypothetical protein
MSPVRNHPILYLTMMVGQKKSGQGWKSFGTTSFPYNIKKNTFLVWDNFLPTQHQKNKKENKKCVYILTSM